MYIYCIANLIRSHKSLDTYYLHLLEKFVSYFETYFEGRNYVLPILPTIAIFLPTCPPFFQLAPLKLCWLNF